MLQLYFLPWETVNKYVVSKQKQNGIRRTRNALCGVLLLLLFFIIASIKILLHYSKNIIILIRVRRRWVRGFYGTWVMQFITRAGVCVYNTCLRRQCFFGLCK